MRPVSQSVTRQYCRPVCSWLGSLLSVLLLWDWGFPRCPFPVLDELQLVNPGPRGPECPTTPHCAECGAMLSECDGGVLKVPTAFAQLSRV